MTSTKKYIWGTSPFAKRLSEEIKLVANTNLTVIISGESGTGKEHVANTIHRHSPRQSKQIVAVDCGSISEKLFESELFGHEAGSFTGATRDKTGLFELANHGTLFLDEITNLSYANQAKLLRALQERKIRKVGGKKSIEVDIRLIAATNSNIRNAIAKGIFREDLYHRLNEFNIDIRPLRNRKDDIPSFIDSFIEEANADLFKNVKSIDKKALDKLIAFPWPGNLRELRNVIRRSVLVARNESITQECLPAYLDLSLKSENGKNGYPLLNGKGLEDVLHKTEKNIIENTLQSTHYDLDRTSDLLKIHKRTLYKKMKRHGIRWQRNT